MRIPRPSPAQERVPEAPAQAIPWRMLTPTALVPNFMYSLGQGAIIPVIPTFSTALGGSLAFSAFVLAMLTVGQLLGTVPAGLLVARVGERATLVVASGLAILGGVLGVVAFSGWVLAAGTLLVGLAASAFAMARHSFVTVATPLAVRGRALSSVAGFARLGLLLGPFLSAALLALGAGPRYAFAVTVASSVAVLVVIGMATPTQVTGAETRTPGHGVRATFSRRRAPLVRLGSAAALLGLARTARQVLVPLWGVALELSGLEIALMVGLASVLDVGLFYVGGYLMDRFGRLTVAVPTCLVFAVCLILTGALDVLPQPVWWLVGIAALTAVVNGLSSGVNATMGSDLADRANPAAFLSSWRLVTDTGPAVAPLLISLATATVSLAAASLLMGALAALSGVLFARYVPRFLPVRRA